MKISKAALATATAIASIKGVAAKHRSSAGLSGVGFDVLHIIPHATAVIDGGTYDARNIVARDDGSSIYDGAYGLFVDNHATATVCNAKIKGGLEKVGDTTYGRGGVYVGSDATLNIVDGVIEGGDSTETGIGAFGIYASYFINEEANHIVVTGGEILGGMRAGPGPRGVERAESIFVEAGGTYDVYGGKIGDGLTNTALYVDAGFVQPGLPTGNNVATVNIYGGDWKGTSIWLYSFNNAEAYLNIYGDVTKTPDPENQSQYLVEGRLCDGSSFKQTILFETTNANPIKVSSDCSGFADRPTFEDDCGSGKKKKKNKSRRL